MSGRHNSRSITHCLSPLIAVFLALLHSANAQNIGQDAQNIAQNAGKGVSAIFNNTSAPANYVMAILCMLAGIVSVEKSLTGLAKRQMEQKPELEIDCALKVLHSFLRWRRTFLFWSSSKPLLTTQIRLESCLCSSATDFSGL
ncbi:hypothetical protein M427DRAFT_226587 [Gonapodya prolifera JEL478]|uniref:Uncharacterized protein n=1 Tax=Gonapodya prolifera (strain JEL478) TaxID=1344416 RepID=A0A139AP79_GONPJ|nr:hypothetical protein M427DRAFT_226587 [Gonapodya prolifera JEL478]|eukprot:KXS18295.1 hypothetical protein M427DRAFT_226587 [Gonapodya prolifera JEL478]